MRPLKRIHRHPKAEQNREQQQGIVGWFAQCLGMLDQMLRPLHRFLGFRGAIAFDVDERDDERDLQFDLLTPQRRRRRQTGDEREGA